MFDHPVDLAKQYGMKRRHKPAKPTPTPKLTPAPSPTIQRNIRREKAAKVRRQRFAVEQYYKPRLAKWYEENFG